MSDRILVTGGAGFIGSNLVHHLLGEEVSEPGREIERVVTLDKLTYAGNPDNLATLQDDARHHFVHGDICDAELVDGLFREHEITGVMHLAAESHVDRSIESPDAFIETNVTGTFRLLHAARKYREGLPDARREDFRFLHVSTDEVYGSLSPEDPAFTETTAYAPNSPYSASKAASDHLARAYFHTYGLPVVTTNCSNNYGPRQFPEKLIPLMIGKVLAGQPLPVYGDGSNIRDWLYVEDHCRGLVAALRRGTPGEVYNIGGDCERSNLEVVHRIVDAVREACPDAGVPPAGELISFVTDRPGHDWRYAIDTTKIGRELDWHPRESFESGLRRTVGWFLQNRDWVRRIEEGTYRGERLGLTGEA